jgi:hypothetical protein
MANLDATMWLDLQSTNATNEKRKSELGLIDLFKMSSEQCKFISPSTRQNMQKLSSLRKDQIPVIVDQNVSVVTTPGFTFIPQNLETSDKYSFVAYDVFSGFRHYPALYDNNQIDSDYAAKEKMDNIAYAIGNTVEGILQTNLEARKTQLLNFTVPVSQGDGTYVFNATTKVLEISKAAQKETMFGNLDGLMASNELPGNYHLVTSRGGTIVQKFEALKYSGGNSKNIAALPFWPLENIHETGNITAGANVFNGYIVREGAVGVIENFPFDFRNNTKLADKTWSISPIELPYVKMRANIYVNNAATDATALTTPGPDSNLIMTTYHEMGIWVRFYVVYTYNSNLATRVNDVVKISGLTV